MAYDPDCIVKVRRRWIDAGSVPCTQHVLNQEYMPGVGRGDWFCTVCGLIATQRSHFDPDSSVKPFPPFK